MPHKRSNWKRKPNVFVIDAPKKQEHKQKVEHQKIYFEISSTRVPGDWTVESAKKYAYHFEPRGKVFNIYFTDPKGVRRGIKGYTGVGRKVTAYVQGLKGLKTIPPKAPIDHLMRRKYAIHLKYTREFSGVREKED